MKVHANTCSCVWPCCKSACMQSGCKHHSCVCVCVYSGFQDNCLSIHKEIVCFSKFVFCNKDEPHYTHQLLVNETLSVCVFVYTVHWYILLPVYFCTCLYMCMRRMFLTLLFLPLQVLGLYFKLFESLFSSKHLGLYSPSISEQGTSPIWPKRLRMIHSCSYFQAQK